MPNTCECVLCVPSAVGSAWQIVNASIGHLRMFAIMVPWVHGQKMRAISQMAFRQRSLKKLHTEMQMDSVTILSSEQSR